MEIILAGTDQRSPGRATIQRMDNIAIVVDDLAAAKAFFVELGLELEGEATVEGSAVDRLVGLEGVRSDIAMMRTPDGHGRLELTKYHTPSSRNGDPRAPANTSSMSSTANMMRWVPSVLVALAEPART
jgi:glyoxalase/bleomycin resistance protein/dioxygenase superfamily protein